MLGAPMPPRLALTKDESETGKTIEGYVHTLLFIFLLKKSSSETWRNSGQRSIRPSVSRAEHADR